ncbi:MAG: ATP-binding cassette domain-containing protein [Pollutimonas bauzanensis]|uniref:Molybdate transport system ATP-binding protein n=1 Tax=Pollutimonas bauzanensis TaxID=658167 RepID=A0A1M5YRP5_9BURK|nr:molybdate transport system ATP-binding protein [Pollutimonas bauzanensis]
MISMHIKRRLQAGAREFTLDIAIESAAPRIALFGPSGSGKTLTVQAIAGLLRPDSGYIQVNGVTLYSSEQGVFLAPQARHLAYLQQNYGLFPHLNVAQNIGFGLKKGWLNPRRNALPEAARRWIEAFELEAILGSYPAEISGGQKQRVALARALAVEPRMVLLDEPLAALDSTLRQKMRGELAALQARLNIPTILITHDPADVVALADHVYQIENGRIVANCSPQQLFPSGRAAPGITQDALKIA